MSPRGLARLGQHFALAWALLACTAAPPNPTPPSPGDPPENPGPTAYGVVVEVGSQTLEIDQTTSVDAWAVDRNGDRIQELVPALIAGPSTVAILEEGHLRGLTEGVAAVSAQLGTLRSTPIYVQVTPPRDTRPLHLRPLDAYVPIDVGLRQPVRFEARDAEGWPVDHGDLEWEIEDRSIATIVDGEVLGVAPGWTSLRARAGGPWSGNVPIVVVGPARNWVWIYTDAPETAAVIDRGLDLYFRLRGYNIPEFEGGGLIAASTLTLIDDDTGEALAEWNTSEPIWNVHLDTSAWEDRTYAIRSEVRWHHYTAHRAPFYITVQHPDRTTVADRLSPPAYGPMTSGVSNNGAIATAPDGTPWIALAGSGEVRVLRYDGTGWVGPLGDGEAREISDGFRILRYPQWDGTIPARGVGGSPGLTFDAAGAPVVAATFSGDPSGLHPFVARWQADGAHPSGVGGWVVLTDDPTYRDLPYVPPPAEVWPRSQRLAGSAYPAALAIDPQADEPVLATSLEWGNALRISIWRDARWQERAPSVAGATSTTAESLRFDERGRVVSTGSRMGVMGWETRRIVHSEVPEVFVVSGRVWFHPTEPTALQLHNGDLYAGRLSGMDFDPEEILDRDPFATVHGFCARARGGDIFVVWVEGSEGHLRLHTARRAQGADHFERSEQDLGAEADPNIPRVRCAMNDEGQAFVLFTDVRDLSDESELRQVRYYVSVH